jgi:Domain of unknown function (DUF4326)
MPVVNKHTHIPTPSDLYVGRGSAWGNDFSHRKGTRAKYVVGSVAEAIERHRAQLWAQIKSGEVSLEALAALHGRTLVCFCAPRPCHAHTLEKAAAWAVTQLQDDLCFQGDCDHDYCAYERGLRDQLRLPVNDMPLGSGEFADESGRIGYHDENGDRVYYYPPAYQDQPKCRTCFDSGRVRSTAEAVPGHEWSAQPCPSCRPLGS